MNLAFPLILAGLMGAIGVILAAAGAHIVPGTGVDGAAYILLFHAAAELAAISLLQHRLLSRTLAIVALTAWPLGAALFAGDIVLRAFSGHHLFPMAAPAGGTILIAAWLALTAAAASAYTQRADS